MEKLDVLVKGIPVQLHNIFKGFCALSNKSVNEGIIDAMFSTIEKYSGGRNDGLKDLMERYYQVGRKK
jgi:hypothetical protein